MEKIFEFDIISVLISVVYFTLVIGGLVLLLSYRNKVKKNTIFGICFGVSLYYLFFLANHIIPFKSIPPDTIHYSKIIKDFWSNYDVWTVGVKLYSLINFIPFQLSLKYPVVFVLINIFFFFAGIILIGKAFLKLMQHYEVKVSSNFMTHLLLFTSIYPAGLIVVPSLLREGSMIFFFGLATFLLIKLFTEKSKQNWIVYFGLMLSLVLLTLIRPVGGVSYLLALFLFYMYDIWRKGSFQKKIGSLFTLIMFFLLINYIVDSFYNLSFSFSWIAKFRASHEELFGIEAYGAHLNWASLFGILKSLLLLFLQYLFSPFPILIPKEISVQKFIPLLDGMFILISMVPILFYSKSKPVRLVLMFTFILILVPSIFETHISGAYRHRMNAIVMLLPLFAFTMNKLILNIFHSLKLNP